MPPRLLRTRVGLKLVGREMSATADYVSRFKYHGKVITGIPIRVSGSSE